MTWFAVPNDVVGGWAVANRQVPVSELRLVTIPGQEPVDVVIAGGMKSEGDARRIAAGLNYMEHPWPAPHYDQTVIRRFSVPWPSAEVEE